MTIKFTEKQLVVLSAIAVMLADDIVMSLILYSKIDVAGLQDSLAQQIDAFEMSDPQGVRFKRAALSVFDEILKGDLK